jgi:hypothetical protein
LNQEEEVHQEALIEAAEAVAVDSEVAVVVVVEDSVVVSSRAPQLKLWRLQLSPTPVKEKLLPWLTETVCPYLPV